MCDRDCVPHKAQLFAPLQKQFTNPIYSVIPIKTNFQDQWQIINTLRQKKFESF